MGNVEDSARPKQKAVGQDLGLVEKDSPIAIEESGSSHSPGEVANGSPSAKAPREITGTVTCHATSSGGNCLGRSKLEWVC